ncbi:hypothetical protein Ddye_008741 [Dipteronia dyeriana]|uniref:Reverse transcriptase zinc-binding domain-containing protein n=1 Tax=Dipteronia dyeriana TaxID=168575 RepID=A0AAE0CLN4_9ROSI|nr:hypothetical protein Ddye_008741 [Dipteronia dyeriana]
MFLVNSFLKKLDVGNSKKFDDLSGVWLSFSQPKDEIFVWHLLQGSVMVNKVLKNMGLFRDMSEKCLMCSEEKETVDHLFLHSSCSWNLWLDCLKWWGINFFPSASLLYWWKGWEGLRIAKKLKTTWVSMFFAIAWTIWKTRNGKVFRLEATSRAKAIDKVKFRVAWWFKNCGKGSNDMISILILDIARRCLDSGISKASKFKEWIPPIQEVLKFNIDGSVRGSPGQAGIGGILRDKSGNVFCSF